MSNAETTGSVTEPDVGAYRAALESLATPILLTNVHLIVTFANEAALDTLYSHQHALAAAFPGFTPDALIGTCVDLFHRDPRRIRRMLRDPSIFPHKAQISIGELHFSLHVTRTVDAQDRTTGYALQWGDVTPRVRYGQEVERVVAALQDGDLTVRGDTSAMDPAFRPMLQGINDVIQTTAAPLLAATETIHRVSAGAPAEPIEASYRGVFAELCDSVNTLVRMSDQLTDVASRIADGDLVVEIQERSSGDRLMGAMSRMVTELGALMRQVQDTSRQLDRGSGRVEELSRSLADNTLKSAASLEQISASMEVLTTQTEENTRNAATAMIVSSHVQDYAFIGDQQMDDMVQAMQDIRDAAHNISKIIKVIDGIAFQTNLLALSAAVEAGRVGTHGRGFAVVAQEVRRLAARSSQAAKETTEMIEGSSQKVSQGLEIARSTATSLSAIVESVNEINERVWEIAAASQEQSVGIKEITEALAQVNEVTQENTTKASDVSEPSQRLVSQSASLVDQLGHFQLTTHSDAVVLSPELMVALQAFMAQR